MTGKHVFALAAFAVLIAFLGVFVVRVPRIDLTIVVVVTIVLVTYDLWTELRQRR